MSVYELYKPLRKSIRQFPLLESLDVVRAYVQYLQLRQPLPDYIEFNASVLNAGRMSGVCEWSLDILARELILNAADYSTRSLRSWNAFATALNQIRELEMNIYAAHRELHKTNILIELFRIWHRQFPWQRGITQESLLRYFKIFGVPPLDSILRAKVGLGATELYTIGLAFSGVFIDQLVIRTPPKIEGLDISHEDVDNFVRHFSTDILHLRQMVADNQSYDQDYPYSFNPLRKYPLVRVVLDGQPALLAPIPTFLLRRFTEGIYYEIYDVPGFSEPFGRSFQNYVGDVLARTNSSLRFIIQPEKSYYVGKNRKDSVDWIVSDATGDLFIECKTKKLRFNAKIGLFSTDILDEDMNKMAGFIVQIYKTLTDALGGLYYPHWVPTGKPIYPLITTLEEWYAFGDKIIQTLDERVINKLAAENISPAILTTYPYTICAVDDFELAIQIMQKIGIGTFMNKKVKWTHRLWNMYSFAGSEFSDELAEVDGNLFPEDWQRIHPELGK